MASTSDQLIASLKAHNNSFNQLLRIIPAQYYIVPEEQPKKEQAAPLTKAQKKKAKKLANEDSIKLAKSEAQKKARIARYDPDEPKTILEIQAAQLAKGKAKESLGSDDDDDDDDDEAVGDDWEDASEGSDDEDENEDEDSPNESDFVDSDEDETDQIPVAFKLDTVNGGRGGERATSITDLRAKLAARITDIQNHKKGVSSQANGDGGGDGIQSKEELLEERRRQRGLLRDNRRKKRKAERKEEKKSGNGEKKERVPSNGRKGGGKANAPVRSDAEEVQEDESERPKKKSKPTPSQDVVVAPTLATASTSKVIAQSNPSPKSNPNPFFDLSFSTLDFNTSSLIPSTSTSRVSSSLSHSKKSRHTLPKDANAALAVLAARKEKLEKMGPEQREKAEEKDRWEKVELKAEGGKVRDDEKRLKKMAKRQEKVKSKSAKAWAERKETVSSTIAAKVAKRNNNMAARAKAVKDKKAGIKVKSKSTHKTTSKSFSSRNKTGGGRPGFEGKGKKK